MKAMAAWDRYIAAFSELTVGVVGDMAADVYVMGHPHRLSREAPVMVVRYEEERLIPGCAANTVHNLLVLGCRVLPVSVLGEDPYGDRLAGFFRKRGVSMEGIVRSPAIPTVAKTRIMVGEAHRTKQQVIRVDREGDLETVPGLEEAILARIEAFDPRVDAWLVSDYDYCVCSPSVAERLSKGAHRKPLVVDSRFRTLQFQGARCLTPNEGEAEAATGIQANGEADVERMARKLLAATGAASVVITRGNQGMAVLDREGPFRAFPPAERGEAVDVTGAGDTVAATLTAALACGAPTSEAALLANCAAGVVVMKSGAATCTPAELRRMVTSQEKGTE